MADIHHSRWFEIVVRQLRAALRDKPVAVVRKEFMDGLGRIGVTDQHSYLEALQHAVAEEVRTGSVAQGTAK